MRISAMCSLTLSNIGNNDITQHTSALVFGLGWLWCCFDVSFSADDDGWRGNGGGRAWRVDATWSSHANAFVRLHYVVPYIYLVHFKSDYLKQQAASTMCGFAGYRTGSSNVSLCGRQLAAGKRCSTRACRSRRHLVRSLARSTLPTNRLLLLFTVCWGKHLPHYLSLSLLPASSDW